MAGETRTWSHTTPAGTDTVASSAVRNAKVDIRERMELSGSPVGSIIPWGSNSIPTGWLECDGSNVSRNTYSALFAIVGTTFGSGDGVNTFGLPDMDERFVRVKSGEIGGVYEEGQETHGHTISDYNTLVLHGTSIQIWLSVPGSYNTAFLPTETSGAVAGVNIGSENAPQHICAKFIIRYAAGW